MCLEVEVIVEVENVHGEDHSYEVTKSFGAYGGYGAVSSGKKVTATSITDTFIVWDVGVKRRNIKRDKYAVTR